MRISSNNFICFTIAVLVISVQCLFFLKNCYDRDIQILQSKVAVLSRETTLLHGRRKSQHKKNVAADKLLLSRLRAVLIKKNRVERANNAVHTSILPKSSTLNPAIHTITTSADNKTADEASPSLKSIAIEQCKDSRTECVVWARNGECKANPTYMLSHCLHSCGKCHGQVSRGCLEPGVDYIGHDVGAAVVADDPSDCQRQCADSAYCSFFTFRHSVGECWLKTKKNAAHTHDSDLTSGPARCGTATPPTKTVASTMSHTNKLVRGNTALLLLCYNRPKYLKRALDAVNKHLPNTGTNSGQLSRSDMPFFISQDGNHAGVASTIRSFVAANKGWDVVHLQHQQQHVKGDDQRGYRKLARHFGWAFETIFKRQNVSNILVLEDDLEVAPDFFGYFSALIPVLRADPTLLSVSAWSDNGQEKFVDGGDTAEVLRSDFFPGLGWVLTRELWNEFGGTRSSFAPGGYWDDWMRLPAQRKGRHVLRPEISRTYTFGEIGVSAGEFFKQHLKSIRLNREIVDWTRLDFSHLVKSKYDQRFRKLVSAAKEISVWDLTRGRYVPPSQDVKVIYRETERGSTSFASIARKLGIMSDIKAGVPRTAYNGVVTIRIHKARI